MLVLGRASTKHSQSHTIDRFMHACTVQQDDHHHASSLYIHTLFCVTLNMSTMDVLVATAASNAAWLARRVWVLFCVF